MILTDLQRHVRTHGRASLAQLALHFDIEPDALRSMLDRLVAKGRIRRLPPPPRCGGCKLCPETAQELYEWAGERGGGVSGQACSAAVRPLP